MGKKKKKELENVSPIIEIGGTEKNVSKSLKYKINLKCKNQKQKELVHAIHENQITFVEGVFGVGKTYVINSVALSILKEPNNGIDRIILIVPTLESGGNELSIGLLPGTKTEKIEMYHDATLDTIKKILEKSGNSNPKEILHDLLHDGYIEMECANFVLGKTWDNAFVIIDEAENFNKQETLLLCSRLGENSKLIFSGDRRQTTRKSILKNNEESGFLYGMKKLTSIKGISKFQFDENDIVRNPILYEIYKKWTEDEK